MNIIKSHPHNKTSPQRMLWPDVIRIIAIYLVVQIHTSYTPPSWQWLVTILFKFGVMGVPLFVILSGALLLGKQEDYKTFFRKRCMRVLLPWIVWTFLYMIYFFKVNHHQTIANFFTAHTSPFSQWLHFFLVTFLTELWFLPMIFSLYLITPLLRIITIYANDSDNFYL
ncbi:MAG TPA: acyltransferase family protein, partial [Methylomirabilota bacterium]|nr:acyltransferase family protein [Methylomirabilota bacterium]